MVVKRSTILINPQFQLKISIFISFIVFLASCLYPYIIYWVINRISERFSGQAPTDYIDTMKINLIIMLALFQLLVISIVFIVCLFQSHKIAGPIFKIRKILNNIKNGGTFEKIYLRKGDNFPELAEDLNEVFAYIQNGHNQDFAYLSEVNSYINNLSLVVPEDKRAVLQEITHKLTEIQDRFKT